MDFVSSDFVINKKVVIVPDHSFFLSGCSSAARKSEGSGQRFRGRHSADIYWMTLWCIFYHLAKGCTFGTGLCCWRQLNKPSKKSFVGVMGLLARWHVAEADWNAKCLVMARSRDRAGFRLGWIQVLREPPGLPLCPSCNSTFLSVGFVFRHPLLHGGKMANTSSS